MKTTQETVTIRAIGHQKSAASNVPGLDAAL
jgi:hypothetical protein